MSEFTEQGKDIYIQSGVVLRRANTKEDAVHSLGTLNIVEYILPFKVPMRVNRTGPLEITDNVSPTITLADNDFSRRQNYPIVVTSFLEMSFGKCIEWKPIEDSVVSENQDQDPEWSLVDTHTRRTRTSSEGPDSLGHTRTVRILFSDLDSFRTHSGRQQIIFIQKDGPAYVAFFQSSNAESFLDSLKGFIKIVRSPTNRNLYRVMDEVQNVLTKSFTELDIFPENTSDYVWKFVKNLHNHPYETTMEAFSKLADIWLYKDPSKRAVEEAVADILNSTLTIDVPHPPISIDSGEEYEIVGEHGLGFVLPPRPTCPRGPPLSQEQWNRCKDAQGRILNSDHVKEVIFRGGVAPSLRFEVWKFLLNYYPWEYTHTERQELKKKKIDEYYMMKLQWKSITAVQESNFSDYRDRKSLIGKDVSRTDRTHSYYSGDNNPHVAQLYDILMTYVMYNFDLGYVQGMSDLLSPILYLMENEVDAFWCFVGFMDKVSTNFEMDQSGMKLQLCQLYTLLNTIDPQLANYLSRHDSGNMFFCFRWLLVLFKREFDTTDILKLWEVLWTDIPCKNFPLFVCLAILDTEKSVLMENRYGFTEILKHINDLSFRIELSPTLSKAESIYNQLLSVADQLSDNVRTIIGLERLNIVPATNTEEMAASVDIDEVDGAESNSRRNSMESENVRLGDNEVSFERGLNMSYM